MQRGFMTVAETAGVLRVSQSTIRNLIRRGELDAVRIGGHLIRIPEAEVRRILRGAA